MEEQGHANRDKRKKIAFGVVLAVLVVVVCAAGLAVKTLMPSKEVMELADYYEVPEDRVMVVLQDQIEEGRGWYWEGRAYVELDLVRAKMNKRFYWDANEEILSYTTPTEVIKVNLESKEYSVAKSKTSKEYVILRRQEEKLYVAMDFVKEFSNVEYEFYEKPNRLVVTCEWGKNFLYTELKKDTQLRFEPSVKAPILEQLKAGERLFIDSSEDVPKGFFRTMTKTGVRGYVKARHCKESYYETLNNDYKGPEYTHIEKEGKVNLVWHAVTNKDANEGLLKLLNATKGVTVVSPTWFSMTDNKGNIASLASEKYVERAHQAGVEVWGLCDDFGKNMKVGKVLAYTSKREKLIKELVSEAIKYELDGINIDFEHIPKDQGEDFIQFIREMSVKCRQNGIVLSIDNYAPTEFTAHYDREEQGIVADYVITMAYDEHYAGGGVSGSVASLGFVTDAVQNTLAQVPPERAIIALPFYTRLWKEVPDGADGVKVSSGAYGMDSAVTEMGKYGMRPEWDEATGQYYAEADKDGARYKIWLEEEKSLEEKLKVVMDEDVAGVAFWRMGFERESVWDVVLKHLAR